MAVRYGAVQDGAVKAVCTRILALKSSLLTATSSPSSSWISSRTAYVGRTGSDASSTAPRMTRLAACTAVASTRSTAQRLYKAVQDAVQCCAQN